MKTQTFPGLFLIITITAALTLAARNVPAQDATTSAAQTTSAQLSYGVSQIVELSKAKVSEDTIVNYIRNSGSSYGMDASQIVYLKQQGVSDTVINTMLNQPRLTQTPVPAAAQPVASTAGSTVTETAAVVAQPAVICAQPATTGVPASSVYVIPDTQTYNYYAYSYHPCGGYYYSSYRPVYYSGYYPSVSFAVGYRGGRWGGYSRGGWGGGYRGGYRGGGGRHR